MRVNYAILMYDADGCYAFSCFYAGIFYGFSGKVLCFSRSVVGKIRAFRASWFEKEVSGDFLFYYRASLSFAFN